MNYNNNNGQSTRRGDFGPNLPDRLKAEVMRTWRNFGSKLIASGGEKFDAVEAKLNEILDAGSNDFSTLLSAVTVIVAADSSGKLLELMAATHITVQAIDTAMHDARDFADAAPSNVRYPRE